VVMAVGQELDPLRYPSAIGMTRNLNEWSE